MIVQSLEGRRLGVVTRVTPCCFSFANLDKTRTTTMTVDGVFDVQGRQVSLIYVFGEVDRYRCPQHAGEAAREQDVVPLDGGAGRSESAPPALQRLTMRPQRGSDTAASGALRGS